MAEPNFMKAGRTVSPDEDRERYERYQAEIVYWKMRGQTPQDTQNQDLKEKQRTERLVRHYQTISRRLLDYLV